MTEKEKIEILEKKVSDIEELLSTFVPDYLGTKSLVEDIGLLLQRQAIEEDDTEMSGEKDIRELIKRTRS